MVEDSFNVHSVASRQRMEVRRPTRGACFCKGLLALFVLGFAGVAVAIVFWPAAVPYNPFDPPHPTPPPLPPQPSYELVICTKATLHGGFSVWAPHASSVEVIPVHRVNSSCAWVATNMTRSGDFWKADVSGVAGGDGYVFNIDGKNNTDPCALDIAEDASFSIVPPKYSWRTSRKLVAKEEAIVYEMHVGSFTEEGTFDAAIKKLPHLEQLGVTMLELMPVMYFCGSAKAWGYNPCAPFAVKAELGGSDGLKRFVDAAAEHGMAVGVDTVWNHLAGDNLLIDYDGWDGGENGIYFYTGSMAYVWGTSKWGPRPDFSNDTVTSYLVDWMAMWIDEFHIGGFRFDATMCMRKGRGQDACWNGPACDITIPEGWRALQKSNNASKFGARSGTLTFAEDQGCESVTSQVNDMTVGPPESPGGAGFDAQWMMPWDLITVFEKDASQMSASDAANVCADFKMWHVRYSESHDTASGQNGAVGRIPGWLIGKGNSMYWVQKKTMLFLGLLMTCPSVPLILQGQEVFMSDSFAFPNPPTYDWSLADTNRGFLVETTDLINLRRDRSGTSSGLKGNGMKILAADAHVAVWHRWLDGGDVSAGSHVLVFMNFGGSSVESYAFSGVPVNGKWKIQFNGDASHYSSSYKDGCSSQKEVSIDGGQGVICLPGASLLIISSSTASVTSFTSTTTTTTTTHNATTTTTTNTSTTTTNTSTTTGNATFGFPFDVSVRDVEFV